MKLNIQRNKKWSNEIMTFPKHQKYADRIGVYGCLITCFSNIMQMVSHLEFTPKDMNDLLIRDKGYMYLKNKRCKKNTESLLLFNVMENILGCKIEKKEYGEYEHHNRVFWIARIQKKNTGHYINVLRDYNSKLACFDVWDGSLLMTSNISWLLKVTV